MPTKASKRKTVPRRRVQKGEGFLDIFKGINNFLRKTHLISGLAGVASAVPGLAAIAAPVAGISGSLGYGKKKKKKVAPKKKIGRGLQLPGKGRSQVPVKSQYR